MISQFFILSPRGDTIIMRDYLGNVPKVLIFPWKGFSGCGTAHKKHSTVLNLCVLVDADKL